MRNTRAAVVSHHVELALRHRTAGGGTRLALETYACDVVGLYEQRTPLHSRHLQFHGGGRDPYADMRANAQLVRRMLGDEAPVRMPAELEEALVLALPEPFRAECLRELCDRYGLLAVRKPPMAGDMTGALRQPAALLREVGEALEALAPVLADGKVSREDDGPQLRTLLAELDDVIGTCMSMKAAAHAALGDGVCVAASETATARA